MIHWLIEVKKKYQFSGWLQYNITFIQAMILIVLASFSALLNFRTASYVLATLGFLLVLIGIKDILMIKFGYSFRETEHLEKDELTIHQAILKRKSCRSFQRRKMKPDHLQKLMNLVEDISTSNQAATKGIRYEYISAPLTVWPVVNASEFLVAIAPKSYQRQIVLEVGRILEIIVIHLTKYGIASCWIGPGADQSSLKHHLGDQFNDEKDHIICVCAVGYRSKHIPFFLRLMKHIQNTRKSYEKLFYQVADLSKSIDLDTPLLASYKKGFEACRLAPSAFNGQPTRAVITTNSKGLERIDFYTQKKSKYYSPLAAGIWCANWQLTMKELDIAGDFSFDEKLENKDSTLPSYEMSWLSK